MASTNCISRTVRICRWRARVNSLWLWPYCILTLALHGYLMYRAVSRCKDYNELPWRTLDKPVVELYVYISLIVLSVMCVPFLIITSIFKVGNYASDGIRLGRDNIHEQELAEAAAMATIPMSSVASSHGNGVETSDTIQTDPRTEVTSGKTIGSRLQTIWRHVGPFSHGFHVISAFSLLLPSMLLEAQEIKYGFRNPDTAWRTDLDWMFGRRPDNNYGTSRVPTNILLEYTSMDSTSPASLGDAPELVGGARDTQDAQSSPDIRLHRVDTISPEYINYIVSLAFYCVRYTSVFWYTKMSFSIVFLIQLFVITIHFAFSFCGAAILYKFQLNDVVFGDMGLAMPSIATLSLYLSANFFLLLSFATVFSYGFQHYNGRWQTFLRSYAPMYCKQAPDTRGHHSYVPHTMASIILLLVILCRGGIVYDYVIVYRKTGLPIILACIVLDAIYMVSWITLWFGLTLKQRWNFQIMFARYVMPTPLRHARANGSVPSRRMTLPGEHVRSPNEQASPSSEETPTVVPNNNKTTAPNGKVVNVDMTDAPVDLHGPESVLRKEKTRRSTSTQRVKFDSSANKDDKPSKVENVDANAKANKRTKTANKDPTIGGNAVSEDDLTGNLRRAYSDSTSRGRNRRNESSSDEYATESTPENTLTRKYRHSIRDTCGLYFRISRDMSPSPAAHSSPLPAEKRADKKTNQSPPREELLLNPLKADNRYLTGQSYSGAPSSETTLSNSYSPGDDSTLALPLNYSPNDSGVQLRRGHHDRDPIRQDSRYSYPLASPSDSWLYGDYGRSSKGQPPDYNARDAHPVRHSVHLDRPRVHDGSYLNNNFRPHRKSREPIPWSPDGPNRSREAASADRASTPPPPPRAPKRTTDYSRGYRNPRDLRIMPKKADLLNRDSALPSSNETSSNDSNDVLCSQV